MAATLKSRRAALKKQLTLLTKKQFEILTWTFQEGLPVSRSREQESEIKSNANSDKMQKALIELCEVEREIRRRKRRAKTQSKR